MATGTYAARPGGFAVKTAAQTLTSKQKQQVAVNLGGSGTNSPRNIHTGGVVSLVANGDATNNGLTDQTPVTTETYFAEILVPVGVVVTGIAFHNGSDVTGNTLGAIADASGAILMSTAATAGSGTDAYQRIALTSTLFLAPGTYYICRQQSSGTARITAHTFGTFATGKTTGETNGTITAITIAGTFTTAIGPVASLY